MTIPTAFAVIAIHAVYCFTESVRPRKRKLYLRDPLYSIPRQTVWISKKKADNDCQSGCDMQLHQSLHSSKSSISAQSSSQQINDTVDDSDALHQLNVDGHASSQNSSSCYDDLISDDSDNLSLNSSSNDDDLISDDGDNLSSNSSSSDDYLISDDGDNLKASSCSSDDSLNSSVAEDGTVNIEESEEVNTCLSATSTSSTKLGMSINTIHFMVRVTT